MLETKEPNAAAVIRTGLFHRYYAPEESGGAAPRPAVLMVHGKAGNAQVMWTFAKAFQEAKPIIVSPQGFLADPIGGFSWWLPSSGEADARTPTTMEQLLPALEKMEYFVEQLPEFYGVQAGNIVAAGFSQGGGLLSALALRHPKLFCGVALLASFVPKSAIELEGFIDPKIKSGDVSLPPFFIAHGTKDETIPIEKAEKCKSILESLGADVTFVSDNVGHKVGAEGLKSLKVWYARIQGLNS